MAYFQLVSLRLPWFPDHYETLNLAASYWFYVPESFRFRPEERLRPACKSPFCTSLDEMLFSL
jgi:hypothetical protein